MDDFITSLFTSVAKEFAKDGIEIFTKEGIKVLKDLASSLKKKNAKYDFFKSKARRYKNKMEERYNYIRIFGMHEEVPLRDIYVRVNILEKITERQRITIETLEKLFERDSKGFGIKRDTKPGNEIANTLSKFIVLGKPGAGKTTFLKYLALQSLDGDTKEQRIPIFISLKDLSDSKDNLLNFILHEFDLNEIKHPEPFITRVLKKGKFQILLDGLDETSKEREDEIIRDIRNFTYRFSANQFVISCRIAAYNYWFDRFTDVEIADFNVEQIQSFVNNWFKKEPDIAKMCWEKIENNARIEELATNPLLLTLICIVFDETLDFPENRAELYEEAIDALLKKWDSSRRITRDFAYKRLSLKRKEALLSDIAYKTFEGGIYFLKQKTLETYISNFITELPGVNEKSLDIDSNAILNAIEVHHGFFVQRAKGIYSFSHLTFQEYFAAKYLVDNALDDTIESLITNHLTEKKWREVFLLIAGMLNNANSFFALMKETIDKLVKHNVKFHELFENVKIAANKYQNYPAPLQRCVAIIFIIAYGLDSAKTQANEIAADIKQAESIDIRLARARAKRRGRSRDEARKLAHALEINLDLALDLAQTLAVLIDSDFSRERTRTLVQLGHNKHEADDDIGFNFDLAAEAALHNYLYTNTLLINCLNTECYVSKTLKTKILQELLAIS